MMKILIISNYLSPEIGAASNRMNSLLKELDGNVSIDVITNMPNYPQNKVYTEYNEKFFIEENVLNTIKVHRIYIPFLFRGRPLISRLFHQMLFAFMSFFVAMNIVQKNKYDLVFVSSPPLFIGYAAFLVSKIKKIPWVLEIRDLWGESISTLTKIKKQSLIMKGIFLLERFLYIRATKIITVTKGIKDNIIKINRVNPEKVTVITNGIPSWLKKINKSNRTNGKNKITIGYIGTLGLAQEFNTLLTVANELKENKNIEFLIVGDGQRKTEIENFIKENDLLNVTLLPTVFDKEELLKIYGKIDIGFISLMNEKLFQGAIPSKLFELAYLKIPIIYSGLGEGADIIKNYKLGEVVTSEDAEELGKVIIKFAQSNTLSSYYDSNLFHEFKVIYNWSNIVKKYKEEFLEIL